MAKTCGVIERELKDMRLSEEKSGTGFFAVLKSIFAALFGIQSNRNRERDFKQGKASDYIVIGFVVVFVLVFIMIMIVKSVLLGQ